MLDVTEHGHAGSGGGFVLTEGTALLWYSLLLSVLLLRLVNSV